MNEISERDYEQILDYYNKPIPKSRRILKKNAEDILAKKLCGCINAIRNTRKRKTVPGKVKYYKDSEAVAICRASILKNKGIMNTRFTCKKKPALLADRSGKKLKKLNSKRKNKTLNEIVGLYDKKRTLKRR